MKNYFRKIGLILICLITISIIGCDESDSNTTISPLSPAEQLAGEYTLVSFGTGITSEGAEHTAEIKPPKITGTLSLSPEGDYTKSTTRYVSDDSDSVVKTTGTWRATASTLKFENREINSYFTNLEGEVNKPGDPIEYSYTWNRPYLTYQWVSPDTVSSSTYKWRKQ